MEAFPILAIDIGNGPDSYLLAWRSPYDHFNHFPFNPYPQAVSLL